LALSELLTKTQTCLKLFPGAFAEASEQVI
jgi:hypothetical protein